jgi:hypothetical protein
MVGLMPIAKHQKLLISKKAPICVMPWRVGEARGITFTTQSSRLTNSGLSNLPY